MPYVKCAGCGLSNYAPRGVLGVPSCPECGAPLVQLTPNAATRPDPDRRLDALLRLTRELLDTDVAILSEIHGGRETARRVAGEWPPPTTLRGASLPLEDTFCQRLLEGRIGNHVGDVEADGRVRDLVMARQLGVRAWLGVPIELADAQLYMLCCLAREARPDLGKREVGLLRGLAESVLAELQALEAN